MSEAVTVPLPAELREHVREQAKREYTSEAAAVRRQTAAAPSDRRLLCGNNPLWHRAPMRAPAKEPRPSLRAIMALKIFCSLSTIRTFTPSIRSMAAANSSPVSAVDQFKNPGRLNHRNDANETRFLFGKSPFKQLGRLS